MSLGDIVVSLSANTARFESDMGKAAQFMERFANRSVVSAKQCEMALKQMTEYGTTSVDRLQKSFDTLNIKSGLQIDKEAAAMQAAFEKIKNSGVASANEIQRANIALKESLANLSGTGNVMKGHIEGMNGFSLASVAAIAKIQILYSLINNTMSLIGSMPGTAVAAIEDFNASTINSAAMIVSMQTGVKDIAKSYSEAKIYSEAVQRVLIKMDSETAASARNLRDMNTQFVQQGVLIDINNQKQIDGFKSVANALSAITANDPNKDMQYAQEIRALKSFEDKGSNRLVQMLKAQGVTKEMYENWKASDTVLIEMGKHLQGFAAAQGDINNLWETVKSTMSTIRDEVLRGGLSQGFAEIVEKMKELSKWATDNKEKVQAFLRDSFAEGKTIVSMMFQIGKGVAYIGEPLLWGAITLGISSAIGGMRVLVAEMTLATGGINLLLAGAAALGLYAGKKFYDNQGLDERVKAIRSKTLSSTFNREQLSSVLQKNPLASNDDITKWIDSGAIKPGYVNQMAISAMKEDHEPVVVPKINTNASGKAGTEDIASYNSFVQGLQSAMNKAEPDEFIRKMKEIDDQFSNLAVSFQSVKNTNPVKAAELDKMYEGGIKGLLERLKLEEQERYIVESAQKENLHYFAEEEKARKQILKDIKDAEDLEAANFKARHDSNILYVQEEITNLQFKQKVGLIDTNTLLKDKLEIENILIESQQLDLELADDLVMSEKERNKLQKDLQVTEKARLETQKQLFDRTALGGMTNAMKNYADEATNTGKQVEQVFTNAFKNIEDSIVKAFQTGEFSVKSFINGIQADLIRMEIAKPATNYIQGLLAQYTTNYTKPDNYVETSSGNTAVSGVSNLGMYGAIAAAVYSTADNYFKSGKWSEHSKGQQNTIKAVNAYSLLAGGFADWATNGYLYGTGWKTNSAGAQIGVESGNITGNMYDDQSRKGSWFRGRIDRTINTEMDQQWTEFVNMQYDSLKDVIKTQSSTIGSSITEEAMKAVDVEKIKIDLAGKSAEEQQKAINEAFRKVQSDIIEKANPAFKNMERLGEDAVAAMERLTNLKLTNNSLQMQILEMQNLKGSAQYLSLVNEQRQNELLKLDNSTKVLQTRLWQLQDEAEKTEKLNKIKDFNNNLISRSLALDGIDSGLFELRIAQEKEMADAVKNHMDTANLQIIQDAEWAKAVDSVTKNVGKSIVNMTEQAKNAVLNLISAQSAIANALKGILLGQMGNLSPEAAYRQAQAAFGGVQAKLAANPADLAALGLLPETVNNLLNASKGYNASGVGFQNDLKSALETMAYYSETSGVTLDAAQTQIDKLEAIRIAVTDSGVITAQSLTALIGIWNEAKAAELKKFQDDAAAQTAARTAAISANNIIANTSAIDTQMMLKAGNIAAETQRMAVGLLSSNLQYDLSKDGIINISDSVLWQKIASGETKWSSLGLPAFASGGDFGGGLRIVGEHGPELEATGASRLFNADQTRGILSRSDDREKSELKEIIRHLVALVRVSQAGFSGTIDTLEKTAVSKSEINRERLYKAA